MLKDLIKKLSAEQVELKKARKTGKYEVTWTSGYAWMEKEIPDNIKAAWKAASDVRVNALKITAALNLYHEVRGSEYRHNVQPQDKWSHNKMLEELRAGIPSAQPARLGMDP